VRLPSSGTVAIWPTLILALLCAMPNSISAADRATKSTTSTTAAAPTRSLLDGLEIYLLDAPHSPIGFEVAWMGLSKVRGTFDDCIGTIVLDANDFTRSTVSIIVRTPSLHTGFAQRDQDLRGADWFDVKKFPIAEFRSTSITKDGDGYRMHGTLTLHGITKEIDFPFTYSGRLVQASHEVRIGCEGECTLHRRDFGLEGPARFNVLTEMGKAMIGDDVRLPLAIEGWRPGARDSMPDAATDSLARHIAAKGFATFADEYRSMRARTPDSLMTVDEGTLNTLGYGLLEQGRAESALQVFQLEAEAYPKTAFALVGQTQTYATMGNRERAIESGEKALAINPHALRASEILRHIRTDAAH
jgi:polyisoprenoid-binding protein YceI